MVESVENLDIQQEQTNIGNPLAQRRARREAVAERAAEVEEAKLAEEKAYQEAREAELGKTITLDDIANSFTLQKLGVKAGDRIKDNELVRIFSTEDDVIDIDRVLTQEDIDNSPALQRRDAVEGDLIIKRGGKKEFLSRGAENQTRQFLYEFVKNPSYIANAMNFLDALNPVPTWAKGYTTPYGYSPVAMGEMPSGYSLEDQFGEDISKLPFNERRLAIKRRNERALQLASGPMFDYRPESTGAKVGAVSKAVIDPINLIPAASTVRGGIALGTAIAGFGSIADDFVYSEEGVIDPVKAGISALAGGVISGGVIKGAKVLGDRGAKKTVRKAQIELDKAIAQGADPANGRAILSEAGIDLNKLAAAQRRLGVKLDISPKKVAQRQAEQVVVNDSALGRFTNGRADKILGTLSTRIKAIDEATFGRLRRFEFDTHMNTTRALQDVEPWVRGFSELSSSAKNNIARLLYNEDFDAARQLMGRGLADQFDMSVLPLLSKMGDDLLESGHSFQKIENYFPRLVKDLEGLQKSLGVEQKGLIGKAQQRYADQKGVSVDKLTDAENAEIIDKLVRGYTFAPKNGKPNFVRQRKLTLTDDQMKYYASPEESLAIYLRRAVNDIEKRKFMGQYGTFDETTGLLDVEQSIGSYIKAARDEGRLKDISQEADLVEMLKSRFIGGEQSAGAVNAAIRDLGYMGTIANPISAITQLGDIGTSGALHGLRNSISAMFGTKNIKLIDIGLDEVSKELAEGSARTTSKMLSKLMGTKAPFSFRQVDRLGKETLINAAFKNAQKMVKTPKGLEKFKKKIGNVYGKETDALIADLQSGNMSDTVKYYLFNALSDVQPVTLSEFPEAYLKHPQGRILYMLKSFTIKQIDVARRNVVQEWAKGNKKEAVKNAALLGAYLSTANTGTQYAKDILLGREVRAEDIPDRALWNLLSVYGLNRYTTDRYWSSGDWKGGVYNTVAPATPIIDSAFSLATEAMEDDPNYEKLVKPVPIVGNLVYNWFLGGAEEYNERQEANRNK